MISIENLSVLVEQKTVITDLSLQLIAGSTHALMGPNGSGKSSLALTLLGHPNYKISQGTITYAGQNLLELSTDKRAKAGIFLAFQYPFAIEGIKTKDFLRQIYNNHFRGTDKQLGVKAFLELLHSKMALLNIKPELLDRDFNVGFSGGEKKQLEILQLAILSPKFAILDEIDSGLDIDALQSITKGLQIIKKENLGLTLLIITHYQRILDYLIPEYVSVMRDGTITQTGTAALARQIDQDGYHLDGQQKS